MASSKPTVLFVHGAYHTPVAWERVIPHLERATYRCLTPQLCFCGTDEPILSWQTCIEQIRDILAKETSAGRDVVVVNHSLGGIPGCSAIKGFTDKDSGAACGRVLGIVQITAMAMRDAAHKRDFYARMADPHSPHYSTPGWNNPRADAKSAFYSTSGWKNPPADAKSAFYSDLDPEDAEQWARRLLPNSAALDDSVEGLYPGFGDVPVWYIMCSNDLVFSMAIQDEFIDVIREVCPKLTVRVMETGHSPMLSRPSEVAEIIQQAATKFAVCNKDS